MNPTDTAPETNDMTNKTTSVRPAMPTRRPGIRSMTALGLCLATLMHIGCQNNGQRNADPLSELDRKLLVGPTLANQLGMRCEWQQEVPADSRTGIKDVYLIGEDIAVADSDNRLTLLRGDSGSTIWHSAPLPRYEKLLELMQTTINGENRIVAATDTDAFVLDGNTGHMVSRQNLPNAPVTGVTRFGPELIFGGADGRIVFHNTKVGFELRANGMQGRVTATPLVAGPDVVGVSSIGEVMMLDANSASRRWVRRLTGSIEAEPAASRDNVFIATKGQSLWCLDRKDGSVKWKYFCESPLARGPVVFGDRVFQQIPSEGLVCFEADPMDSPRGKVVWTNRELDQEIVTVLGNDLLLWDSHAREATLIDSSRGDVKTTVNLSKVEALFAFRDAGNKLILITISPEGTVQRLGSR